MATTEATPLPCPYVPGAKFRLRVSLPTGASHEVQVTVVKTYAPFTISPVMKISLDSVTPGDAHQSANLPPELILKIYDRRFALALREQLGGKPPTYESEALYQRYVASGKAPEGYHAIGRAVDDACTGGLETCPPEIFEHYASSIMDPYFGSECAAYKRLTSLQGHDIPVFYGATQFIDGLSIPDLNPPFVPGVILENIDHTSPDLDAVLRDAIRIVHAYGDLGVLNADVRLGNFIVKPDRSVVMVDFAQSRLRREDETDLEWKCEKWGEDEEGCIGFAAKKDFDWPYVRSYKYLPPPMDDC
ncbi:hypothetical protein FRC10_001673 [Ceratobasidium sp. 414]|nr:hypothetical protein FRC10_001673 [Ceratobasidium sp. 414]